MAGLRTLAFFYRGHLRARPLSELLALVGIAAGVALLFAVQVANTSVTGSFEQLSKGVRGRATLEVATRSPEGFDQGLVREVKRLADVEVAAPLLERRVAVVGPEGRRPLTLVGIDRRIFDLGGTLVRPAVRNRDDFKLGLYLTEPTARDIGAGIGDAVTVEVGERKERVPLVEVLPSSEIGPVSQSPVAIVPLGLAQEISDWPGRITRVLVAPVSGRQAQAKAGLERVAADRLDVRPSDAEPTLLREAATADRQSSALFSAISLVMGLLLAYNAMLLTMPQRRAFVARLDLFGASDRTIVASTVFDALVLGLAGSLLGILLGDLLSRYVMHQVPGFLASAFAIGEQRIVKPQTIILSILGGTLAALAASARPAFELLRVDPLDAFSAKGSNAKEVRSPSTHGRLVWGGIGLVSLYLASSLLLPDTTLFATVFLILGMIMLLPPLITYLIAVASRLARRTSSASLRLAVGELSATPTRAMALAAIGALSVFGIVSLNGSSADLQRGVAQLTANFFGNADLWVSSGRDENVFGTHPFSPRDPVQRIKKVSAVKSVRLNNSSYLDWAGKRLWVYAESGTARLPIAPSDIIDGDLRVAVRRLRQGGWIALTSNVAEERNLHIGQQFSLPTATGHHRLRLAATITNYGWPSGTILINKRDYRSLWQANTASVLEIDLKPGVPLAAGRSAVRSALGKATALKVQPTAERRADIQATARQGLSRLDQIADMVLIAAILAVVAAMLAAVWQRRQRLWGLVSMGMGSGQLIRSVFLETGMILLLGCLIGAAFGVLGQALNSRWLELSTGFPASFSPAFGLALKTLALATGLAVITAALPLRIAFSARRVAGFSPE